MAESIKKVVVIGASGNLGSPIVSALLAQSYTVSALTRDTSTSTFPPEVSVYRTDYTPASLLAAFTGQDAVVCAIATSALTEQKPIIDAAAQAGVKRFIPAEFGCDTAPEKASQIVPPLVMKQDVVAYLKTKEKDGMAWTAICCGMFFDWSILNSHMQFQVPAHRYTIFSDGNHPFIGTTLSQIARSVAAVISPSHLAKTANRYIYISSSFSSQAPLTQNLVLSSLERACGSRFTITRSTVDELAASGLAKMGKGLVMEGLVEIVNASMYGYGGLNEFSKEAEIWNKVLGLPEEDLDNVVQSVVAEMESKKNGSRDTITAR